MKCVELDVAFEESPQIEIPVSEPRNSEPCWWEKLLAA